MASSVPDRANARQQFSTRRERHDSEQKPRETDFSRIYKAREGFIATKGGRGLANGTGKHRGEPTSLDYPSHMI